MDEVKKKIRRKTPPGRSCVDTLQRLFEADSASRMKIKLDTEHSRSSKGSGCAPHHCPKG